MTPEPIPVLTLWQPYASLCVIINPATGEPYKTVETRGWSTKYRGPLAIHAAAKSPGRRRIGPFNVWIEESYVWWLDARNGDPASSDYWPLPLGAIVATCTLVDVVPIGNLGEETAVRRIEVGTMAGEPNLMLCAPDPSVALYEDGTLDLTRDAEAGVDFDASDYYEKDVTDQLPYGLFEPGRYAWLLADVVPVDPPVPFKGGQGLTRKWTPAPAEQSIA